MGMISISVTIVQALFFACLTAPMGWVFRLKMEPGHKRITFGQAFLGGLLASAAFQAFVSMAFR